MADREFCKVETHDHVMTVTLERPEVMNAVHPPAAWELSDVFDKFAEDPDLWVGIITGAGDKAFSAGNDLKYQAGGNVMETPPTGFGGLGARDDLNKPLIAAVNGLALGGGFTMAIACDLVVAAEHAVFGLPEPKVGLAAVAGGLARLPRQIGLKPAMSLILTGRQVSASEGLAMGFVNEVVPASDLMACALRWAQMIVACSPLAVQASKEVTLRGLEQATLGDAIAGNYPSVEALRNSADYLEGPLAFAQKRRPEWSGK
jgi:enoyl-CoA hydratase/carnithine racemase